MRASPGFPGDGAGEELLRAEREVQGQRTGGGGAVTSERITGARAVPQNWRTYHGACDGQRYGARGRINTGDVARLRPAWIFHADVIGRIAPLGIDGFEAAPLAVDGVMYISGRDAYLWALDVTGEEVCTSISAWGNPWTHVRSSSVIRFIRC